jgi:hypothetical protein
VEVPAGSAAGEAERQLGEQIAGLLADYESELDGLQFRKAAQHLKAIWSAGNAYLDAKAPGLAIKEDPEAAALTLRTAMNLIFLFGLVSEPVIPEAARTLQGLFRFEDGERGARVGPGAGRAGLRGPPTCCSASSPTTMSPPGASASAPSRSAERLFEGFQQTLPWTDRGDSSWYSGMTASYRMGGVGGLSSSTGSRGWRRAAMEVMTFRLATNQDGRLELLAIAGQGSLGEDVWHTSQTDADSIVEWTTTWESLGAPDVGLAVEIPAALTVATNADGRLEAVVRGRDQAMWHTWQGHPGGDWRGWQSLGTPPSPAHLFGATLARNVDGRLELFTDNRDDLSVWHRWQPEPGGGPWAAWHSLGKPAGTSSVSAAPPVIARNADGRLELFTWTGGAIWHTWQRTPAGGPWAAWESLGKPQDQTRVGEPKLAQNQDGRLELFALADGSVVHRWQSVPGGGPWAGWRSLGQGADGFSELAVGRHADGRLVVVALARTPGGDQEVWRLEQTEANNGWSEWRSLGVLTKFLGAGFASGVMDLALISDGRGRLSLWSRVRETVETGTFFFLFSQSAPSGDQWLASMIQFVHPPPRPSQPPLEPRPAPG